MRHLSPRLLVLAILLAWMAPGIGALSVGLHLAHGHHGSDAQLHDEGHDHPHHTHPQHEQAREIADLARAAVHGHHHGHHHDQGRPHDIGTDADHEHDARLSASTPLPRALPLLATAHPSKIDVAVPVEPSRLGPSPRARPPGPLFTVHCSLLL